MSRQPNPSPVGPNPSIDPILAQFELSVAVSVLSGKLWVELESGNETVLVVEFRDRANNTLERAVTVVQVEPAGEAGVAALLWWTLFVVGVIGLTSAVVFWKLHREEER